MANEVKDELIVRLGVLRDRVAALPEDAPNMDLVADVAELASDVLRALRPQREDAGAGGGDGWFAEAKRDWFGAVAHGMMPSRKWADKYAPMFLAAPQPSAPVVWELEAAKHAHWEAFEGDSSGMVDDAERAKRNMRLWHAIEATLESLELSAAPQPSAPEGLREALTRAQETLNNAKVTGENATSQRALEYRLGELINLLCTSPSPPTGRDATEEGWIEWNAGQCPVAPETEVYWQRRLEAKKAIRNLERECKPAADLRWSHRGSPSDIIAYRLAAPKPETAQKGGKP